MYGIQRAFLVDWYFVDRTLITDRRYYPEIKPAHDLSEDEPSAGNNCIVQIVTSSPISEWPDIMQGYIRILLEAKKYVYIDTTYVK